MTNREIFKKLIKETRDLDFGDYKFELSLHEYINEVKDVNKIYIEGQDFITKGSDQRSGFTIFWLLQLVLRRHKDYNQMGSLIENFKNYFINEKTFPFLESLYLTSRGFNSAEEGRKALSLALIAHENCPDNHGIAHSLCSTYCSVYEKFEKTRRELKNDYQSKIKDIINRITINPSNNKFYSTQGRFLATLGQFEEGIIKVNKSIALEDSNKKDYQTRINDYYRMITEIKIEQKVSKVNKITSGLREEVGKIPKTQLGILSIFVSIAIFAVGGVSIAKDFPPYDAAILILITFLSATLLLSILAILMFVQNKRNLIVSITLAILLSTTIGLIVGLAW